MENKLCNNFANRKQNWPWLLSVAKRYFDIWATQHIGPHLTEFKISYMPIVANINPEGSTNKEIAKNAVLAKQGMSRTLKELQEQALIYTEINEQDKRSATIKLTKKGENCMLNAVEEIKQLTNIYKQLVGEKEYNTAIEVLQKIVAYHESTTTH